MRRHPPHSTLHSPPLPIGPHSRVCRWCNRAALWLSSGLEDYFLGTHHFPTGRYHTPIAGLTHFNAQESACV